MNIKKETEANVKMLVSIRDDVETSPAVRIQAIQTLQKIMDACNVVPEGQVTEDDIMKKIRGKKK